MSPTSSTQQPARADAQVRIKDVAKRANVAPSTVSLALSGNGYVSDAMRKRIIRIADVMNYRPKLAARLLRARNTGYMGLIVNSSQRDIDRSGQTVIDPRYSGWQITGFLDACRSEGVRHQVEVIQPVGEDHSGVSQLIQGGMIDGAVIAGLVDQDCPMALDLQSRPNFPWVSFDEPAEHCVLSATDQGVEQAMQYLAAMGHQRVGVTHGDVCCLLHAQVKQGFDRAVKQFGIQTSEKWIAQFPGTLTPKLREQEMQWVTQLLQSDDRPTAIICGGVGTAAIVLHVAATLGIDVPSQLSVIAVGFSADATSHCPVPTILERDYVNMMRASLSMVRALLEGRTVEEPVQRFVPNIIHGQTVDRPVIH